MLAELSSLAASEGFSWRRREGKARRERRRGGSACAKGRREGRRRRERREGVGLKDVGGPAT
jgi:hypothetical protein